MAAIDNARRHFDAIGVRKIEVPEWGESDDQPLAIYFSPFTLADKQKLAEVGEREGFLARLADALIMKATDAEGKKLFTIDEKRALRTKVDPDVIARVVAEMMRTPSVDDMEKNSSRTPS
jgi:hypothetical protein